MNNREREKKFVVDLLRDIPLEDSYSIARYKLLTLFPDVKTYEGKSTDTFWTQPGTDFIRLRANTKELTVKVTDMSTIEDRLEENVIVKDLAVAERFAKVVFGQPIGVLEKNYFVITTPDFTIALYTVTGHDDLFLEIEAESLYTVTKVADILKDHFSLRQEMRSLFNIIFGDRAVGRAS